MAKATATLKTCKNDNNPAMPHRTLCKGCYRNYQREYMRKKYKEEKEIYLRLESEKFTLDPFVYRDGYELRIRKITKTAGIKIELVNNGECYAIILPPDQSRGLISYIKQVLKCETE